MQVHASVKEIQLVLLVSLNQWVRRLAVNLEIAGSIPVKHNKISRCFIGRFSLCN